MYECSDHAHDKIWSLARELWPYEAYPWLADDIGVILGCGNLFVYKPDDEDSPNPADGAKKRDKGASRLLRILISESAHLIWCLRCTRANSENQITFTEANIAKQWTNRIERRLTIDRVMAAKIVRTKKAIEEVKQTWKGTLREEDTINANWVTTPEVLVGIRPPRDPT